MVEMLQNFIRAFSFSFALFLFHFQFSVGNPDTLICGNCREYFSDLSDLLEHKRSYCKLRFTCKCQDNFQSEFAKYRNK